MSVDDPVIITNSISGVVANRDQCPGIPYTPEEYAAEARRAVDDPHPRAQTGRDAVV
jgi:3-keto-5-aminohexanoate cleavage enzyme